MAFINYTMFMLLGIEELCILSKKRYFLYMQLVDPQVL